MQDAWRAYLELALGLTEASKKKAQKVASKLVGQGGATAAQLQGMAEEMLSTGLANREALVKIIRFEVDRALGKVGLATAEEVADLNTRVGELQQKLREAQEQLATAAPQPAASDVAKKTVAKKTVAKKTVAKKSAGETVKQVEARKLPPPPAQKKAAGRTRRTVSDSPAVGGSTTGEATP